MPLFDILADRLVDLPDADLRELVARLCEAERERQGGHRCEVRWGGAQTAPDGGLDVVVTAEGAFGATPFLPCRAVGVQVKKDDLAPAAIEAEMCPGEALRPSIARLAAADGAYVIASVGADCSDVMRERRETAMRRPLSGDLCLERLRTRFVDRHDLARWTSAHPSVAIWLRGRLGLPVLAGWHTYGRWSATPAGEDDVLICEPGLRVLVGRHAPIEQLEKAIEAIRSLVRDGTKAVRVAGLSGVGKSRIVQALFEDVGAAPLPASQAVYADAGYALDPSPATMLDMLMAHGQPAILIVDNCPPDTHQALAQTLSKVGGPVRLITVEYDVRADRPDDTDVVRIEAEGPDIVRALLERRRPDLAGADARRLAELAQGNARLGLALAGAAPEAGTLSAFEDTALFDRLFWQRGERDPELARAAQALSLVYSFDVEGDEAPDELAVLGGLVDLLRGAMHRQAATMLGRGLAQARGRWRAVLPHALANRLAGQALREMPWRGLADAFADPDTTRLRSSFARRLAYLHDIPEARRVVLRWMEPNGPLYGPRLDLDLLARVCHLAPREALDAIAPRIAAAPSTPDRGLRLDAITRMLVRIAHADEHFAEACAHLVDLAEVTRERANVGQALKGLFGLYLSRTMARTETRAATARGYLCSSDPATAAQGLVMAGAALRTGQWMAFDSGEGDARPGTWGWRPQTSGEILQWYEQWIDLVVEAARSSPVRGDARTLLAEHLDGLWRVGPPLHPKIEAAAVALHEDEPWVEGWLAVRSTFFLWGSRDEPVPEAHLRPIRDLARRLEPTNLLDQVRAAISTRRDFEEGDARTFEGYRTADIRRGERLEELGRALAGRPEFLTSLGAELFYSQGKPIHRLGAGLARGLEEPSKTWVRLRDLFLADPERAARADVLAGFVVALDEDHPDEAEAIRLDCLARPALRRIYPVFVPVGAVSPCELRRLLDVASDEGTRVHLLEEFIWSEDRALSDPDRVRVLRAMVDATGGSFHVLEALNMLRHVEEKAPRAWPADLCAAGLAAVVAIVRGEEDHVHHTHGHHLGPTLEAYLLSGDEAAAAPVFDAIAERAVRQYGFLGELDALLAPLAARVPEMFLDRVVDAQSNQGGNLGLGIEDEARPLDRIEPQLLIGWCAGGSSDRWLRVAEVIAPFGPRRVYHSDGGAETITVHSRALLDAAPNPLAVLEAYLHQLAPTGWSGSRAAVVENRLPALEALTKHPNPIVRDATLRYLAETRSELEKMRQRELKEEQNRDQRFE